MTRHERLALSWKKDWSKYLNYDCRKCGAKKDEPCKVVQERKDRPVALGDIANWPHRSRVLQFSKDNRWILSA